MTTRTLSALAPAFPELRSRHDVRSRAPFVVDWLMLLAAVALAEAGAPRAGVPFTPGIWVAAFPLLAVALLAVRGLYRPRIFMRVLDDLRVVVTATALAAMTILSLRVVLTDDPWVAAQTARTWAFATAYLVAGRTLLAWWEMQVRQRGGSGRPTLIVGAGRIGSLTARRLLDHPEYGLRPVGFLDKEPLAGDSERLPVLGASWDLDRVVVVHGVRHVVVTFSTAPDDVLLRVLGRCHELGLEVSMVPRFYEKVAGHIGVEHLGGIPLMTAQPSNPRGWHFTVKYASDRIAAALIMLVAAPVFLAAVAAVRLSLGRPIFFRQARVGRDGQVFEMLKFRTMRGSPETGGEADAAWAEQQLGAVAPSPGELVDRSTRAGRLLRRYSIDELPQLWNVLVGDMSLVGPRPERIGYVELFDGTVYRYGDRHRVKAGITGWAQVHGLRGKTSLADRVEWDNYYIENWSLWLDVKVLLLTALALARPSNAE